MRVKLFATAVTAGLSVAGFHASANAAQATEATTGSRSSGVAKDAELEALKAQLRALQGKVSELETRTDAQASANNALGKNIEEVQKQQKVMTESELKKVGDKLSYKGVDITLGGFVAAESIYREHNLGADIGSNFNAIPFKNASTAHTGEFRYSSRQSRLSALIQGNYDAQTHLAAYYELDFLGGAQTANQNESNSFNPRTRNVYMTIDWDKPGLHMLAGQNWSLLTLNSVGITPRTELTPPQIDAQYIPGFTWARQTQLRLVKDWGKVWWAGISLENPQTTFYTGPNAAKAPVVPTYNINAGSGYDSANTLSLNHIPDVVLKVAADPGFGHYELVGLGRAFYDRYSQKGHDVYGGGIGAAMVLPLMPKTLDFQLSGLTGKGVGRYGSTQLADVTFKPEGDLAPIKETMLLAGLTWHADPSLDVYGFAGSEWQEKRAFDYNGVPFGYGNPLYVNSGCNMEGSKSTLCVGNTEQITQGTLGLWWKFYQGQFGKAQFGAQYSYTEREAFRGVGGSPTARENMFFTSLRYYPF